MKITFVHTPNRTFADTQMFGIHLMPVWAYTLAAHLADGPDIEMALFDSRYDTLDEVAAADVFLFSGINQDYDDIVAAHRALAQRFPAARSILGGPITWSFHTAGRAGALAMFDHVVVGDGEAAVPGVIAALRAGTRLPHLIEVGARFPLGQARPMHRPLLAATLGRYYGAVLEVSRGCPFLCEFCDIRVLPDNNRSHVKSPALIVAELDALFDLGARQVLLACDNFIGDLRWAEAVCDAIDAWQRRTGRALSLYTWLTVNVARHPVLLEKLRRAGFDMLYIGVESFSSTPLLETAKLQNAAVALPAALRTIQSYGFIVVAGLIFGFDTDPPDVTEVTLRGILESGLISGDPSLLTALPGTPLYRRMALAGRLRDGKLGLGGLKYQTNIRYLKPAARIRSDFQAFVGGFNRGAYQLERLRRLYALLESPCYVRPRTVGYADLPRLAALTLRHPRTAWLLARRLGRLGRSPSRLWYVGRALLLTLRRTTSARPLWFYFKFWLFNWSNALLKYASLSDAEFDVESVAAGAGAGQVLPAAYETSHDAGVPLAKIRAQRRATVGTLRRFLASQPSG